MYEFQYVNLCNFFSCTGNINKKESKEICFASVLNQMNDTIQYTIKYNIIFFIDPTPAREESKNNYCIITKQQLKSHLTCLKKVVPCWFKINKIIYKEYNAFSVDLCLVKCLKNQHKYALTWLRYAYEYPFNVMLKDALTLKQEVMYSHVSLRALFNIVAFSSYVEGNSVHWINEDCLHKPVTNYELLKSIVSNKWLNDIYKTYHPNDIPTCYGKDGAKIICSNTINKYRTTDLEYWDLKYFSERKKIYNNAFNVIKNAINENIKD